MENPTDHPPQTQTRIGKCRWFDPKRGWGFLTYNDKDFFVHHNQIIGKGFQTLKIGEKVRFKPDVGEKGGIAKNVERIRD